MQDFETGTVRANQLTFAYLTQGDGPLALCIHGFPDSPYSYRYLLPALADADATSGRRRNRYVRRLADHGLSSAAHADRRFIRCRCPPG